MRIHSSIQVGTHDYLRKSPKKKCFLRSIPFSGTVWLFGKVFISKARAHVSCCVTVRGIQRRVFLLKKEPANEDDEEVTMAELYEEFSSKVK